MMSMAKRTRELISADNPQALIEAWQADNPNEIDGYVSGDPSYRYDDDRGTVRTGGECCRCGRQRPNGATMVHGEAGTLRCVSCCDWLELLAWQTDTSARMKAARSALNPEQCPPMRTVHTKKWRADLRKAMQAPRFTLELHPSLELELEQTA